LSTLASTPDVAFQGERLPVWKPGLPRSCCAVQPPAAALIVQVNEADPLAPVVSVAFTVTVELPAVVGCPRSGRWMR
jgi:hypothetical protein